MPRKKELGNEAQQEKEPVLPSKNGSNTPKNSSNMEQILTALRDRQGRNQLRKILGPTLPGIVEHDIDEE